MVCTPNAPATRSPNISWSSRPSWFIVGINLWSFAADDDSSFIFVDSSYSLPSADDHSATIISQRIPSSAPDLWCFRFSYKLFAKDRTGTTLEVHYVTAAGDDSVLFSTSNPTYPDAWQDVMLQIIPSMTFQLTVIGSVDANGPSRIGE